MAKGDPLKSNHNVTRLCGRGWDSETKTVSGAAFELRRKDEGRLSVDWVECLSVDENKRNPEGSQDRLRTVAINPQYCVVLNVGEIRKIKHNSYPLDVIEHPTSNPCHCGIIGMQYGPASLVTQGELADLANSKGVFYWIGK